jgi:hypothetical protein
MQFRHLDKKGLKRMEQAANQKEIQAKGVYPLRTPLSSSKHVCQKLNREILSMVLTF